MKPMHILMLASTRFDLASYPRMLRWRERPFSASASPKCEKWRRGGVSSTQFLGNLFTTTKDERVGSVEDLIITPDKAISYAIVNAGGFLGLAKHNVAIPVSQFKLVDKKLVLPGATKEALKASPEFQYAQ